MRQDPPPRLPTPEDNEAIARVRQARQDMVDERAALVRAHRQARALWGEDAPETRDLAMMIDRLRRLHGEVA